MADNQQQPTSTTEPSVEDSLAQMEALFKAQDAAQPPPRPRWKTALYIVGALLWFAFLLTPCALFTLASEGEITIGHPGDMPAAEEYPLLQVGLIMERESRGLRFTRSALSAGPGERCVQTHVSYLMWEGSGEAVSYCDCYERDANDTRWLLTGSTSGMCG